MRGVRTVARLELKLRYRAGRWRWLLLAWFLGLVAFAVLLDLVVRRDSAASHQGITLFGGLQLFMLALALFIVPALTSQSVNGDRERGRLAVLQVTELSAGDILWGKLLAAWGVCCVFVLASVPLDLWALGLGGITVWQVVATSLIMVVLLGVICAIGLGLSALLRRSTTSSVLTYVAVFVLAVGTVILAGLLSALTLHSDGRTTWQVLTPNPFVILADAAPSAPPARTCYRTFGSSSSPAPTGSGGVVSGSATSGSVPIPAPSPSAGAGAIQGAGLPVGAPALSPDGRTVCFTVVPAGDVLGGIRESVRTAEGSLGATATLGSAPESLGSPVWPYGLAFDVVVAGVLLGAARRRLRTPYGRVPSGLRLA